MQPFHALRGVGCTALTALCALPAPCPCALSFSAFATVISSSPCCQSTPSYNRAGVASFGHFIALTAAASSGFT
eukprot:18154-Heterococcus_DN1.PRE.7